MKLPRTRRLVRVTSLWLCATSLTTLAVSPAVTAAVAVSDNVTGIRPKRVVIVSVRDAGWQDVSRARLPKLFTLLNTASIGAMSLHGAGRGRPGADELFVTLSAGTRSLSTSNESCRNDSSIEIVCRAVETTIRRNHDALYGSEPFLLGATLARQGIDRGFGGDCASLSCAGALGLVDSSGRVASWGSNLTALLERSAQNLRSSVAMIDFSSPQQLENALTRTAQKYLEAADLVVFVSPTVAGRAPSLSMFAMRSQTFGGHYLASPTTRREGIVQMIDVAPTVLALFSIDVPASMEGRRIASGSKFSGLDKAVEHLQGVNRESRLRDRMIGGGVAALATLEILVMALLCLLVLLRKYFRQVRLWQHRRFDRALMHMAIVAFAYIPATLVINLFPLDHGGHWLFWTTLGATTLLLAALAWPPWRAAQHPLIAIAAITAVVLVADGLTGTHLSYNSIFGYSATAGGRFVGYGNSTFAFLAASSFVVINAIKPRWIATVALGLIGLVVAAPPFGSDIGGAMTMAVALLAYVVVRDGVKLISRAGARLIVAMMTIGIGIGIVDSLRPSASQTHLGRFIDSVTAQGGGEFSRVLHRKWVAAAHQLLHSVSTFTVPIVVALMVAVWFSFAKAVRVEFVQSADRRAVVLAIASVAVAGSIVNDSGISVALAALGVAVPAFVWVSASYMLANPGETWQ